MTGALLALGDVHGSQGDGELSYVGLEICAQVKVRMSLIKDKAIARPLIETPEFWVTTGEHKEMAQATRMAAEEMAQLLQRRLNFSFEEAYMLMSAAVDMQICQCCDPGIFPVTTRAVISKGNPALGAREMAAFPGGMSIRSSYRVKIVPRT